MGPRVLKSLVSPQLSCGGRLSSPVRGSSWHSPLILNGEEGHTARPRPFREGITALLLCCVSPDPGVPLCCWGGDGVTSGSYSQAQLAIGVFPPTPPPGGASCSKPKTMDWEDSSVYLEADMGFPTCQTACASLFQGENLLYCFEVSPLQPALTQGKEPPPLPPHP